MRSWIETLNHLGARGEPCLFMVDFDGTNATAIPLSDVNPSLIQFDFRGFHNVDQILAGPAPTAVGITQISPPSYREYRKAFSVVRQAFVSGDSYLLNLSASSEIALQGTLESVFASVQAPYRLLFRGDPSFVVFSPECFIRISDNMIQTFPMKGSLRCKSSERETAAKQLLENQKELAEHITIVDLMRNDIGRVAHGISVPHFRFIDEIRLPDGFLLQTSSEVIGHLDEGWQKSLGTLISKLLPAGSISGAPKKRTLEYITQSEDLIGQNRGWYTGVCGIFDGKNVDSAVMIRFIEQAKTGKMLFKSGGGLTVYSQPQKEYRELVQKIALPTPPRLLETIRIEHSKAWNIEAHQHRIDDSALSCFSRPVSWHLETVLEQAIKTVKDSARWRCRIVYTGDSAWWTVEPYTIRRVTSLFLVDVGSLDYRHKYEDRTGLDELLKQIKHDSFPEHSQETSDLLLHRDGVLLEGRYAALIAEIGGTLYSPLDAMLPSTKIAELQNAGLVERRTLRVQDLEHIKNLYLVNAMMGIEDAVRISSVVDPLAGKTYRFDTPECKGE